MRTLQTVRPTPEQLLILTDDQSGFRLIRGAAGSGKTTAALMRLRQLCASRIKRRDRLGHDEPVRVLVLTFNRTLRGYVQQLVEEQVANPDGLDLTVETCTRWALGLIGQRDVIGDERKWIVPLLQKIDISNADLNYFVEEITYVMGRFIPTEQHKYIETSRTGRGRAPTVSQQMRQRLLTDVIEPYQYKKSRFGKVDWNDIAIEAKTAQNLGYDIIVVDESQDLSANQLRAILAHLKKDHVTTFIIDAVQRIYPQGFQWRELGIEMRPQMVWTLGRNHRNTGEIARLASSLVRDLPPEDDGVLPDAETCQRMGSRPQVIVGTYSAQLNYMLKHIQSFLATGQTVVILHPKGGGWFDYTRQMLQQRNIPYCELTRERDWPSGPELVALSTIHSVKGIEFDHVLLPGLNREVMSHGNEDGDGTLDSLRRLIAMGIGRARHTVTLGYKPGEQSTLIGLIDKATYDEVKV